MIFKSLTTRVIVILIGLLSVGIGTFTYLNLKREKSQLIKAARENTHLLLNTIERSIFKSMSIGDTQVTHAGLDGPLNEFLGRCPQTPATAERRHHLTRSRQPATAPRLALVTGATS